MAKAWQAEFAKPSENNITVGKAVVPYDDINLAWVKVGGKKIDTRKHATEYAKKLNLLITKHARIQ